MVDIVGIIILILLGFCVYMLLRNEMVFRERRRTAKKVFEKDNGNYVHDDCVTLLSEMELIATYPKMMCQFWKKPSSFYKEFLRELEGRK